MLDLSDLTPVEPPATTRVGDRLLRAASDLFYDRGITAVGVDLLAERAGTTKRTLYQRFGSKDGLVTAYLRRRAHAWQSTLLTAVAAAEPRTPADALAAVFDAAERWAATNPRGCAFVNAWAELGAGGSEAVAVIGAEKRWMLALFERMVGDADKAAQIHLVYEGAHVAASTLADGRAYRRASVAAAALLAGADAPAAR